MSGMTPPEDIATRIAEHVLRAIYGDDFRGCTVSLDEIAAIIRAGREADKEIGSEVSEMLAGVVEAVHLLSTPPDRSQVPDPVQLQSLLSKRLDSINEISGKAMSIVRARKALKPQGSGE